MQFTFKGGFFLHQADKYFLDDIPRHFIVLDVTEYKKTQRTIARSKYFLDMVNIYCILIHACNIWVAYLVSLASVRNILPDDIQ